jgi:UDP-2-acetamido-2-deoxy-ribo-hexuluronate aminotransferase
MLEIRNHGQESRYRHVRLGLNGRLDTIQAAVLLSKLEVFDRELELREEVAARYRQRLTGIVDPPWIAQGNCSVYAQYTVEVEHRERVADALRRDGIPTAIHYPVPAHLQPAFRGLGPTAGDFPVSERASERVLSLPMHPYVSMGDQERICEALQVAISD